MEYHNSIGEIEGKYIAAMFTQKTVLELQKDLFELFQCDVTTRMINNFKAKHKMIKKPIKAKCDVCGKEMTVGIYSANKRHICSNQCRWKVESNLRKSRQRNLDNQKEIAKIEIEARKQGMSYGQYVGLMYQRGEEF